MSRRRSFPLSHHRSLSSSSLLPYRRQRSLCTPAEWRFCQALQTAAGDRFTVMMQVRVGSLLACQPRHWKRFGRKVAQKSFDFVLVERGTANAVIAIELDDKSHLFPERRQRDRFINEACRQAGLPLVRFKVARRYDVAAIRDAIDVALLEDGRDHGFSSLGDRSLLERLVAWVLRERVTALEPQ